MLDSFARVDEAVAAMRRDEFRVFTTAAPAVEVGTVHPSFSDASGDSGDSGDSAIFQ